MRALAAGIPYDEIGDTTLREIDRRWQAKELEVFLYVQPQLELKMMDMSARQLGEAEDETETDPQKLKEKQDNHARWEARGAQIKEEIREQLLFSFMPSGQKAMYVQLHGFPGRKETTLEPLEGITPQVARTLVKLLEAKTFTHGAWAKSRFRAQLQEGDARKRLELTAKPNPKN